MAQNGGVAATPSRAVKYISHDLAFSCITDWIQELPNSVRVWHFISNETKALGKCWRHSTRKSQTEYIFQQLLCVCAASTTCGVQKTKRIERNSRLFFCSAMQCVTHIH